MWQTKTIAMDRDKWRKFVDTSIDTHGEEIHETGVALRWYTSVYFIAKLSACILAFNRVYQNDITNNHT